MAEQPPATVLPVYMNQYEAKISILAQRAQERRRRRQTSALVFLLFIVLSGLYLYSITRDTRDVAGGLGLARRHWWQMLSLRRPWGPRRHHNHPHRPRLRLDDSEQHHNDNDKPHHAANANDMVVVPGSHHAVKVVDGDAAVLLPEMPHRSNTNNATIDSAQICRNTAQGKWLVTDDRGVVCSWRAVDRNGCCATSSEHEADIVVAKEETAISLLDDIISGTDRVGVSFSTAATSCLTCNDRECCGMFEFCVSCCMRPAQALRAVDLFASADPEPTPSSYTTAQLFEACTALCRTSSRSIRWNHTFKHDEHRHCYRVLSSPSAAISAAVAAL